MDPQTIVSIITGATALVVAVGGYLTSRTRKITRDTDAMEHQLGDAMEHIFKLELELRGTGQRVPPRPRTLRFWSDDGSGTKS